MKKAEFVKIREFTPVIIFVIFPQKWQFRLEIVSLEAFLLKEAGYHMDKACYLLQNWHANENYQLRWLKKTVIMVRNEHRIHLFFNHLKWNSFKLISSSKRTVEYVNRIQSTAKNYEIDLQYQFVESKKCESGPESYVESGPNRKFKRLKSGPKSHFDTWSGPKVPFQKEWNLFSSKLMVTCQNTILVHFSIVRNCNFDPNSKCGSGSKWHFKSKSITWT